MSILPPDPASNKTDPPVRRQVTLHLVDEDDFRLACAIVINWRKAKASDPELIDRVAAALTAARFSDAR